MGGLNHRCSVSLFNKELSLPLSTRAQLDRPPTSARCVSLGTAGLYPRSPTLVVHLMVTTIAGDGSAGTADGGFSIYGSSAQFMQPCAVVIVGSAQREGPA